VVHFGLYRTSTTPLRIAHRLSVASVLLARLVPGQVEGAVEAVEL